MLQGIMSDIFGGQVATNDDCKQCPILLKRIARLEAKIFSIRLVCQQEKDAAKQTRSEPGSRGQYGYAQGKIDLADHVLRVSG